jgi:hypothetical protein
VSTGSEAADKRIAAIAAAAPDFTDEQFAEIKRLMARPVTAVASRFASSNSTADNTRRAA